MQHTRTSTSRPAIVVNALACLAFFGVTTASVSHSLPANGRALCSRLSISAAAAILGRPIREHTAMPHSCIWMSTDSYQGSTTRQIVVQVLSTDPATIQHMESATKQLVAAGHGTSVPGIGSYAAWMRSPETPSHVLQVFTKERALAVSLDGANLANDLNRARTVAVALTGAAK